MLPIKKDAKYSELIHLRIPADVKEIYERAAIDSLSTPSQIYRKAIYDYSIKL